MTKPKKDCESKYIKLDFPVGFDSRRPGQKPESSIIKSEEFDQKLRDELRTKGVSVTPCDKRGRSVDPDDIKREKAEVAAIKQAEKEAKEKAEAEADEKTEPESLFDKAKKAVTGSN